MATAFGYSQTTTLPEIFRVFCSVGTHIAAKLAAFGSDERTLTDEVCDMSCIWTVHSAPSSPVPNLLSLPTTPFQIQFGKTTARDENKNGADLKLTIRTPSGYKTALFQAKAIEPSALSLRRSTSQDWDKLETQLQDMRARVGDTSFLLPYVPAQQLKRVVYGFGTWEQGLCTQWSGNIHSRFGATVIPVDRLLTPVGKWKYPGKVQNVSKGKFSPRGLSFARMLLELVCCLRGNYSPDLVANENFIDFTELSLGIDADRAAWNDAIDGVRRILQEHPESYEDGDDSIIS